METSVMSIHIVEEIQQRLGFPHLHKVDPNIQETKEKSELSHYDKLAQASIPTVLAGLFSFTRTDKGTNYILSGGGPAKWLDMIFGDKKSEAVEKVAHYAGVSKDDAADNMEDIAEEAVAVIHENSGAEKATSDKMKNFMSDQRHHILVYLPAALQMGGLLGDSSLDDRTNKMEGPISSFMHNIEDKFSGGSKKN